MGSRRPVAYVLLLFCLSQSITAYCQSVPKVTFSEKNASLQKVLNIIRRQTGFTYFGDASWPQIAVKVTISVTNMPLSDALALCFRDQPLTYELLGNAISIQVKGRSSWVLRGTVSNAKKEPVPHATILSSGGKQASAVSDDNGWFNIVLNDRDTSLLISSVSYESREIRINGLRDLSVELKERISELVGASVIAHTGYQDIPKDRATGSFAQLNAQLISRRVSTSVLDRLDGITSSLIFNKNNVEGMNQSAITIRGRSTIFANPDPLIVVDNFPYSGDINNINPDDVESVTVLKDAAAASIWGAFSGNGVIVITTKKGKYGQRPKWGFNTSLTVGEKPDLYYQPILSSKDYIQVEQYLFGQHYYDQLENNLQRPVLSPVVELLIAERDGKISADDAMNQIDVLAGQDTRRDLDKYFYRPSLNQQYSLSYSGGSARDRYYVSGGYNKDLSNLVRNQYTRATFNVSNTLSIIPKKLELSTDFAYTSSTTYNDNIGGNNVNYPYVKLADSHGNALAVPFSLRKPYADTVGGGQLLDWSYHPLDELHNADDKTVLTDTRFNASVKYDFLPGLNVHLYYQYEHGKTNEKNLHGQETFYTRDLINRYSQPGPNGTIVRPIPLGGILDENINTYDANNVRVQLNYDHHFNPDNLLVMLAGTELRDVEGDVITHRFYGYDPSNHTSLPVNYTISYPQYFPPGAGGRIPLEDQDIGTSDRFLSYYANASYSYLQRFILSASARRDESNLFGVNSNQKGVPLWSVGGAWEISREDFYPLKQGLPFLKLRITNGYNGNVDRSVSAYTTAILSTYPNDYGSLISGITNPPNPDLRWEKINTFNIGLDFSSRGNRIEGSLEYYIKSGKDLIGLTPVDPTTGVLSFTGNTANMVTHGTDLTLHTRNITGPFRWSSDFLFSYVKDRLTRYAVKFPSAHAYLTSTQVSPIVGRPLYSVFALKWLGLDHNTGSPLGLVNGHSDTAYSTITGFPTDSLLYKGATNPTFFGSFRNTFNWRQFEFSFNIVFKFGYYFRRNSINYSYLFAGVSKGHPDYEKRWQKPGDEKYTYVPSIVPVPNVTRDEFYSFSEVLIEKGDHIRLQDIQLSYDMPKRSFYKLPVQAMRFYLYANNIGILWRANHQGIDPDYTGTNSIPNPRTLSLGCKLDF